MSSPAATTDARTGRRPLSRVDGGFIGLLLLLIAVLCGPGLTAPKLLDDLEQTIHVEAFRSWRDIFGPDSFHLFRPFKNAAFYALTGASPLTCHLFTLAFYALAAIAVYALLRRLLDSPGWAFAGALLWATCPTHTSTALWLSAFNLSLALALACVCLLCHDRAREGPGRRVGLSVLACLLLFAAQLSYETAVAVPGLCVLIDCLRRRAIFSREAMIRYAALGVVTLIYLVIRSQIGAAGSVQSLNYGFSPELKPWQLSFSAPWLLWRHFSMWLMPIGRLEFCSTYLWGKSATMWELVAAWIWLLLLLLIVLWSWRRLPLVAIGILWFLAASFPPSNFVPIGSGPIEDYYLIFPSVGLVLIVLGCARPLLERWQAARARQDASGGLLAGGLLVAAAAWRLMLVPFFWLQADLWKEPLRLYLQAERTRPYQFQLQNSIAKELILRGNFADARTYAAEAYQDGPWNPASSMMLGYLAYEDGDMATAESRLTEALGKSAPGEKIHDFSRLHLAKAMHARGIAPAELRDVLRPLLEAPDGTQHAAAIELLINAYLAQRSYPDALRAAEKARQLHPNDPRLSALPELVRKAQESGETKLGE